jgi:quercetin dioxygenase-like cupin family protein
MQNLSDIKAREIAPGFWGRMVHGDRSTLAFWEIRKGSVLARHSHMHEQITHILEGELLMQIGDQEYSLGPGAVYVIPSQTPHSAKAITDCRVIDSFSPSRDDYR